MDIWYQKNFLSYCLWPISLVYRGIVAARAACYRCGIQKTQHFPVPVIVVGNITVGGTGKTPLVIWLAKFLQERGFKPGIVSRGYGGKSSSYPCLVTTNSDPLQVGDEALLIARKTNCPMMIDPKRPRAVEKLLEKTDCNIIISDDGLQHYALHRDIEIAVIDGARRFGNGFHLPAGPLREPMTRLKKVDLIVNNADFAVGNEHCMQLIPEGFVQLRRKIKFSEVPECFHNKKIHAVAAIGNPQRFFNTLQTIGINFSEHIFPDHHIFRREDLAFAKHDIVLMTEKDAVKCEKFATENYWYLPVVAELPREFAEKLLFYLEGNSSAAIGLANSS